MTIIFAHLEGSEELYARLCKQWSDRHNPEVSIAKALPVTREDYVTRTTPQAQGDWEEYLDTRARKLRQVVPTVFYKAEKLSPQGLTEANAIRIIAGGYDDAGEYTLYLRSNGYDIDAVEAAEYTKRKVEERKMTQKWIEDQYGSGD